MITEYAADKKAIDIAELDLRGVLGYTDFFVVCSGNTDRQTKAIHDGIHQGLKKEHGVLPRRVEGLGEARWILMDYLDVVVHVFTPEAREFYRLEQLWGEAPRRAVASSARLGSREGPPSAAALRSGARGTRTPGLLTASQALSQLSYSPERVRRPVYKGPSRLAIQSRRTARPVAALGSRSRPGSRRRSECSR